MKRFLFVSCLLTLVLQVSHAQFLMDLLDTTKEAGKGLLGIYQKYDHLRVGGYIQPQFQLIQSNGAKAFEGGDFAAKVNNRFMLRRSRIRIDYQHNNNDDQPGLQMVFQFDANERAFTVRDVWGRVFENKFKLFSFTIGMFARPFGYEVNLSSSDRETPERGRMSQTLMKSERDLGAMLSLDVRRQKSPLKYIRLDMGLFNGQGINAAGDFDNRKDFIGRLSLKPLKINRKTSISGGLSLLRGGLLQNTKYAFRTGFSNGVKLVLLDSSAANIDQYSPRNYMGADVQVKWKTRAGFAELRAEYISGIQTGTSSNSETPPVLMTGREGYYQRNFNGAYIYVIHHIFNMKHQLVLKYDWYDPNTKVAGREISGGITGFSVADVKYSTLNLGYNYAISPVAKLSCFYAIVKNEPTALNTISGNLPDNVLTTRIQFRF